MAKFKKGESGNPGGRPKNSKNKRTTEFLKKLDEILGLSEQRLIEKWEELSTKEVADLYKSILQYRYPRLTSVDASIYMEKETNSALDKLSEEQKQVMFEQLLNGDETSETD